MRTCVRLQYCRGMTVELRRRIFRHFADTGLPPELARDELEALAAQRAVVLDDDGRIAFANPFATGPAAFTVATGDRTFAAVCPWDALGILALLDADGRVTDADGLSLEIRDGQLAATNVLVHFLVPAAHWYEDLRFT
jgi:hypothetical protein